MAFNGIHSPLEDTKATWRNGWFYNWGKEYISLDLEDLSCSRNQPTQMSKNDGSCQGASETTLKGFPLVRSGIILASKWIMALIEYFFFNKLRNHE